MNTTDEEKQHPVAPIAVSDVSANAFYHFLDNAKTHLLGRGMDFEIARATCENGWVDRFFDIGSTSIALFLVGLADYLCHRKRVKPFPEYEKYRSMRLACPIYPIRNMYRPGMTAQEYDRNRSRVQAFAIPELARMNIFLSEDDIWQKERAYGR